MPMTSTRTKPTLGGGETGRLERSTPVSTGARTEGFQSMNSHKIKAAVVPKAKRNTNWSLAVSVGSRAKVPLSGAEAILLQVTEQGDDLHVDPADRIHERFVTRKDDRVG